MKLFKILLFTSLFLVLSCEKIISQVIVEQDYDGVNSWTYTTSPAPNNSTCQGNGDVWNVVSALGNITIPNSTGDFWGVQDLNGATGCGTAGLGTIDFSTVNIAGCTSVEISFDYEVDGFNAAADEFSYIVTIDGVPQTEVFLCSGCNQQDLEGTETITIPNGSSNVSLQLRYEVNGGTDYSGIDNVTLTGSCSTNTITTTTVSPLTYNVDCSNGELGTVDFTSTGTFNAGNTYTAELSDAAGSFVTPTSIGTLSSSGNSGTINITVPPSTPSGTNYRIRVVSDNPSIQGSDNGSDITVNLTGSPCPTPLPASGGLLINEFSNGAAGNEEYYEFVIAGQCGETVDVRGYILDDNNGTFSEPSGYPASSGIANGHMRLTNNAQWSNIPVGAVVVIYNNSERNGSLPPDDPFDSDNDSLYVIPHDNTALFEIESSIPNASDPDSTYSPSTYTGSVWSALSLRNGGDAVQIRRPDGSYFHGVSYGGFDITGGPEGTKITTSGLGGSNASFGSGDFTDPSNWTIGAAPADETPGTFNNAANEGWLRLMRDPNAATCPVNPLPVTLVLFEGEYTDNSVRLFWESSTEQNNNYYEILHSIDGYNFKSIGTTDGAGSVSHSINYEMEHRDYRSGINYYRLRSIDFDGTIHEKGIIAIMVEMDHIFFDQISSQVLFPNDDEYSIFDISGKLIKQSNGKSSVFFNKQGVFLVVNQRTGSSTKLIIQ